jgi:hypothetical protein
VKEAVPPSPAPFARKKEENMTNNIEKFRIHDGPGGYWLMSVVAVIALALTWTGKPPWTGVE